MDLSDHLKPPWEEGSRAVISARFCTEPGGILGRCSERLHPTNEVCAEVEGLKDEEYGLIKWEKAGKNDHLLVPWKEGVLKGCPDCCSLLAS